MCLCVLLCPDMNEKCCFCLVCESPPNVHFMSKMDQKWTKSGHFSPLFAQSGLKMDKNVHVWSTFCPFWAKSGFSCFQDVGLQTAKSSSADVM